MFWTHNNEERAWRKPCLMSKTIKEEAGKNKIAKTVQLIA